MIYSFIFEIKGLLRTFLRSVHNLATQACWLQQKHYNLAHESHSGTAFTCRIVKFFLYLAGLRGQVAYKHNWGTSLNNMWQRTMSWLKVCFLSSLNFLRDVFEETTETHQCFRLEDVWGRMVPRAWKGWGLWLSASSGQTPGSWGVHRWVYRWTSCYLPCLYEERMERRSPSTLIALFHPLSIVMLTP